MSNRIKLTDEIKDKFLDLLKKTGNISKSVKLIGISRMTVYSCRKRDSEFAAGWDEAIDEYVDALEAEADRRAVEGTLRPVFYKGEQCGEIREYSDTLLIFRLKALRPEKYRDRSNVAVPGNVTVQCYTIADLEKAMGLE